MLLCHIQGLCSIMTDQGSEGLLSPFLRAKRLRAARPHLFGRVLDVGCGSGTLADLVDPDEYLGVDRDKKSIERALRTHPQHKFSSTLPPPQEDFDTIVALAVIEHVQNPVDFFNEIARRLRTASGSRIIVTTPHPATEWIHHAGSRIGLFSKQANEEHEHLLDRQSLMLLGIEAGLRMINYRRFLLGANQLAIYTYE
jgi:SAM-dependent methyltransferase